MPVDWLVDVVRHGGPLHVEQAIAQMASKEEINR